MEQLPASITITVALLTVFLSFITVLKYAVEDDFVRTRLIMTSFFFFIVATLTISFYKHTAATLPFTIPAWILGVAVGYIGGVRAAQARLKLEGVRHYMRHFAHVHIKNASDITWWSVVNFYSVMSALVLINLVGLSTVIFRQAENWAVATSTVGAFLLGTIAPYLVHLWRIRARQNTRSSTSER